MQTYLFPWRIEEVEENTKIKRNCVCVFWGGIGFFFVLWFFYVQVNHLECRYCFLFLLWLLFSGNRTKQGKDRSFFFFYQKLSTGIAKVLFFFFCFLSSLFWNIRISTESPFFFLPLFFFLYFLSRCLIFWIVFFFFSQLPVCCSLFVLLLCLYSFHHLTELSLLVFSVTVMWYLVTSALSLSLSVLVLIYDSNKEGKEERHQKKCPTVFFFFGGETSFGWVVDCAFLSWKEVDTTLRDRYIYIYICRTTKKRGRKRRFEEASVSASWLPFFFFFLYRIVPPTPPHPSHMQ